MLVDACDNVVAKLESAVIDFPGKFSVVQSLVDSESRQTTFHRYNLDWVSGTEHPDKALYRVFPGLKCLDSLETVSTSVVELIEDLQLDPSQPNLLVIELPALTGAILDALEQNDLLRLFSLVVIVPHYRAGKTLLEMESLPISLHPVYNALPHGLLPESSCAQVYVRHPLIEDIQSKDDEIARLQSEQADQLEELRRELRALNENSNQQAQAKEALVYEKSQLLEECQNNKVRIDAVISERDSIWNEKEALAADYQDKVQLLGEAQQKVAEAEKELGVLKEELVAHKDECNRMQRQRDDQFHRGEALADQLAKLKKERDELVQRRDHWKSAHQQAQEKCNSLESELKNRQQKLAASEQQNEQLRGELEQTHNRAEEKSLQLVQEQRNRQQLVDQELMKAEAQLELIKDVLIRGKGV
ncbi:hypothetical protein FWJ25_04625 [Marinobacter salinexigens]|uniref:Uncharacterized protein n=1 Tax=Marinobacter salinexigens TaxID=2919747 RepID=A0A5B0VL19_9GAMM|nr:hypothetical protein [Marinobacter salinexigens]KAA1174679.1 hypothetical protein FWJ25_04625 [Marinobacter salinexigens]